jgi:hypothetical protein
MESKKAKNNVNKNCNELLSLTLIKEAMQLLSICDHFTLAFTGDENAKKIQPSPRWRSLTIDHSIKFLSGGVTR